MRRAKLEGRQIGRRPIDVDRPVIFHDRSRDLSLIEVAHAHGVSRAMIGKVLRQALTPCSKAVLRDALPGETAAELSWGDGRVAEWLMAPVLKTGVPERVSGVRIPPLPPFTYPGTSGEIQDN